MTHQDHLSCAVDAFNHWRETRPKPHVRIPDNLRQQAVALLSHYNPSQICKALRLSGEQLKAWQQQVELALSAPEFVALPSAPIDNPAKLTLEVDFKDRCQLRLAGNISTELLCALTQSLMQDERAKP